MNNTEKLLTSTKIYLAGIIIMLLNISLWLLGCFYDDRLLGLAFVTWYLTIFTCLYLFFILIPKIEAKERYDRVWVPIIKARKDNMKLILSMFGE